MFAVIAPDSPNYGDVISRHRTLEAAERAVAREAAAFQKFCFRVSGTNGGRWIEREIVECERNARRVRRAS